MINILEDIGDLIFGNKRLAELSHFAKAKGFQFRRRIDPADFSPEMKAMEVFDGPKKKSVKGYMYRKLNEIDTLTHICDYQYHGDFGKTTTTLFIYATTKLDLPKMIIRPKGGLGRLGSLFSSSEWSSLDPEFAKLFDVESTNMPRMSMTITMQFAEVMTLLEGFTLEGMGDYLVLYKKGAKIDIIDMDNVYDAGLEILDIITDDYAEDIF